MFKPLKFLFFIASLFFFTFGFLSQDINFLFISLVLFFAACLLYTMEELKKRIVYFFFLATFFVFLIGEYLLNFLSGGQWWLPFSAETAENTTVCLFLSLLALYSGFRLYPQKPQGAFRTIGQDTVFITNLRTTSKYAFYLTYLPAFYVLFDKITFVRSFGYAESYFQYTGVSLLLSRLASANLIAFFLYLAAMPEKKDAVLPVSLIAVYGVSTLFTGARSTTITLLLVLFCYFIFRDNACNADESGWLNKRTLRLIAVAAPLVILFMSFWGYYRVGRTLDGLTLQQLFLNFFRSQGGSVDIISYGKDLEGQFPATNISYTFGPVINFLKNNILSRLLFAFPVYPQHTAGAALYGNDFSQTITYMVMPWNYRMGIGMGSCYVAEVFIDFGRIGLCVFNFILGLLISSFDKIELKKPWMLAIMLVILKSVLTLPRSSALSWLTDAVNIVNIGVILALYLISHIATYVEERKYAHDKCIGPYR